MLVMKHHESNCKDKSILGTIGRAIDSSIQLRSKKDLIHGFISTVNAATDVDRDWQSYVQQQKQLPPLFWSVLTNHSASTSFLVILFNHANFIRGLNADKLILRMLKYAPFCKKRVCVF